MNKCLINSMLAVFFLSFAGEVSAQVDLLRKIKDKAEDKMVEEIFKEDEKDTSSPSGEKPSTTSTNRNTRGGGLNATRPDVAESIADAESAFGSKNYSAARNSVRQAIMSIELEIGENVLSSLPSEINGMAILDDFDNVTSSGIGFVGLTIERTYQKDDQDLKVTIANDAAMLSAVNMYIAGSYSTSSEDEQYKQIQFQGNSAVIEYDDYDGYTLSVPFGQSSIFVLNGINFENEDEFMSAANAFDIEKYKIELGEK